VIRRFRARAAQEDGLTIMELMAAMTISLVVFGGLYAFLNVATSNSNQISARIEANKLARPVMARITDELHSVCVAPAVAPVLAGSTGSTISFVHQTGSAVTPVPVKRTITYDTSTTPARLTESVYPVASGTAPAWTFSTTASTTRTMLTPVQQASIGSPAVVVPVFRYYAFNSSGVVSTTPLTVPLSVSDAAKVVQVNVSFAVPPRTTTDPDPNGVLSLSDTVIFRFTPPAESTGTQNLPCA